MPQHKINKTESSTNRRKTLGRFIQEYGDIMPKACSNCRKGDRVCKVHVRSGVCGECHLRGGVCDVRITQNEWERLLSERTRLLKEIKETEDTRARAELARADAERARLAAEADRQAAVQKEWLLREEMRKLEAEAADAVAVEEAQILALERHEASLRPVPDVALSPLTWSATEGIPDEFWDSSLATTWVLADS